MKKRTLAAAALTAAMILGMSLTSFAAEEPTWIVPKTLSSGELNASYGTTSWGVAEAIEQARAWAESNKADVIGIQDEKARYEAIVKKVCNFLTYDINYMQPHIAYTIRDGRGVCSDYTMLITYALCEKCGINAQISHGVAQSAKHEALWVTLNGTRYFSDPTNYDTGAVGILMASIPSYYSEGGVTDGILSIAYATDGATGENSDFVQRMEDIKAGTYHMQTAKGTYLITKADYEDICAHGEAGDYDYAWTVLAKYTPVK